MNPFTSEDSRNTVHTASDIVLEAKKALSDAGYSCEYVELDFKAKPQKANREALSFGPMLHSLMDFAPNPKGKHLVAEEILKRKTQDELKELGLYFYDHLLLPMRAAGGRTPDSSSRTSVPSIETNRQALADILEAGKRNQRSLRNLAQKRDGYRCVLTRKLDSDFVNYANEADLAGNPLEMNGCAVTEVAHILPFSLTNSKNEAEIKKSSAIWAVIESFAGINLDELNGKDINRLENALMLSADAHKYFGELKVCLEPVLDSMGIHKPNEYCVKLIGIKVVPGISSDQARIVLENRDSNPLLPLPDPRYLALHAACAKIAYMSGAAELIDDFLREYEEQVVLASDGSSVKTLRNALTLAAARLPVY